MANVSTDIPDNSDDTDVDLQIIQEGQYVFIRMPSGNTKVVILKKQSIIPLGKFGTFKAEDIIGMPFGHTYEIYGKNQVRITKHVTLDEVGETEANNREIFDDPSSQKLTYEEVERLKQEGLNGELSGGEIITKIVNSHGSFEKKTEYSKAKYIKRKEKKFLKVFTPIRPTLYSVCEYFFAKNNEKIRNLRIDTLSQILSFANVHASSKLLVIDDTQGLVISAVAERLGGHGILLGIHEGQNHNYDILKYMNFSKHVEDSIYTLSWAKTTIDSSEAPFEFLDESQLQEKELTRYRRRKKSWERLQTTRKILWEGKFDGIIIAGHYSPVAILEILLKYLSGSRPIVIYSVYKEVLLEACTWLRHSPNALNVQMTESWLREYQVLPGRTHPEMTTSGGGGYIVTAMRVLAGDVDMDDKSAVANKKRSRESSCEISEIESGMSAMNSEDETKKIKID